MTGTSTLNSLNETLRLWQRVALLVAGLGVAGGGLAALIDWRQFLQAYLVGFLFWWLVTMGCLGLLMLYELVGGRWGQAICPLAESGALMVPWVAILFLPIAASLESLYPWTQLGVISPQKMLYLNPTFFYGRAAACFVVWSLFALLLRRRSSAPDTDRPRWRRLVASGGLVMLVLSVTFAAIDWAMSLDPAWYSSIYGALMLIGGGLAALALVTLLLASVSRQAKVAAIAPPHVLGDLGTLLLAFLMLWAYFAFSQFLIIWSGDLLEENYWYIDRLRGGWQWVGVGIVVLQFAVPFMGLLSRERKQNPLQLARLATLIFVMQFISLLWTISPSFHPRQFFVHWADVVAPIAIGGVWMRVFLGLLSRRAGRLIAANDSRTNTKRAVSESNLSGVGD